MESEGFNDFGKNSGFQKVVIDSTPAPFPDWYIHNTLVLEIANNFPFVRWLMHQHKEKILKNISVMEHEWFTFLINNKISILDYKKDESENFIKNNYKKLGDPENRK